jgi:hypothetical protein
MAKQSADAADPPPESGGSAQDRPKASGPVAACKPTQAAAPPNLAAKVGALWTAVRAIAAGVVLASFLLVLGRELLRDPVLIDIVGVPDALAERGLGEAVLSERLWAEMSVLANPAPRAVRDTRAEEQADALDDRPTLTRQSLYDARTMISETRRVDVVEPVSGWSLQEVSAFVRRVLDLGHTRAAVEVECTVPGCGSGALTARLSLSTGDGPVHLGSLRRDEVDALLRASAEVFLREIDPYSLARGKLLAAGDAATAEASAELRAEARAIALEAMRGTGEVTAWAANLLGIMAVQEGDLDEAAHWYRTSLDIARSLRLRRFESPVSGLAVVTALSVPQTGDATLLARADGLFLQASYIDPGSALNWYNWGAVHMLEARRRARADAPLAEQLEVTDSALGHFCRAEALDPGMAEAKGAMGGALTSAVVLRWQAGLDTPMPCRDLTRIDDPFALLLVAEEKLRRAALMSRGNPEILKSWDVTLDMASWFSAGKPDASREVRRLRMLRATLLPPEGNVDGLPP